MNIKIVMVGLFIAGCSDSVLPVVEPDNFCDSDNDCSDGETCQTSKDSCGMECAPAPTVCTLDLKVWCGCNGLLYKGSGTEECMKTAVDYVGLCEGTTLTNLGTVCQGSGCCSSDQDCGEGWTCNQGVCLTTFP